jgi:hypothetical protein
MVSQGLALTLALGLLLWVKLRLVTNVTRTAYAEPDKKHVQPAKPKPQVQPPAPAANEHAELAD